MKKILMLAIVFFLLLRFSNSLKAQEYIPIPLDSTMWKVNYWHATPIPNNSWNCYVYEYTAGDTIINGNSYTLINRLYDGFCSSHVFPIIKRAAIRQDSIQKKIYIIRLPDSLTERILYDFSQIPGDTCNSILYKDLINCGPLLISSIDSIHIDNRYHKRLNLQCSCFNASIIEGIGSTFGLIERLFMFEDGASLICAHTYRSNPITIYPNSTFLCDTSTIGIIENNKEDFQINIFPNPFYSRITIEFSKEQSDIDLVIFDIYSRLIYKSTVFSSNEILLKNINFPPGMYFYKISSNKKIIKTGKIIKN